MTVRIMRSQKASMEQSFRKVMKSIQAGEPLKYRKNIYGGEFYKIIEGGDPLEYHKNVYGGEF